MRAWSESDDQIVFTTALATSSAVAHCPTHAAVLFPDGRYKISGQIRIKKPIVLRGATGEGATLLSHGTYWSRDRTAGQFIENGGTTYRITNSLSQDDTSLRSRMAGA